MLIIHARHCKQDQQGKVARTVPAGRPLVTGILDEYVNWTCLIAFSRTMKVMFAWGEGLVLRLKLSGIGSVCDHLNLGRLFVLFPLRERLRRPANISWAAATARPFSTPTVSSIKIMYTFYESNLRYDFKFLTLTNNCVHVNIDSKHGHPFLQSGEMVLTSRNG